MQVGIVTLLALTGMLVFTLFFVAATVNAIVISLLISLAAVGGFLAIFFSCLTAIYITLLCIAAFVTFTVTISSIIAALVAAGIIFYLLFIFLDGNMCLLNAYKVTDICRLDWVDLDGVVGSVEKCKSCKAFSCCT